MPDESEVISHESLREIEVLRSQVFTLFGQWTLLCGLFGTKESTAMMNWAYGPLTGASILIFKALRSAIFTGLRRLFDPVREKVKKVEVENLSLRWLIREIAKEDLTTAVSLTKELEQLELLHEPIIKWCHKTEAHLDHEVAMALAPLPTLLREEVQDMFDALRNLMDKINLQLDGAVTPFDSAYKDAARPILRLIEPGYRESTRSSGIS